MKNICFLVFCRLLEGLLVCARAIPLPIADHALTVSLPIATRTELTAKCEGSLCGVAGVAIPFPHHSQLLSTPSRIPYQLLTPTFD